MRSEFVEAYQRLKKPGAAYPTIHIAGTNGKGSVASLIAANLPGKVGLFTSPHLDDYRERIRIDGEMITRKEVEEGKREIEALGIELKFFEMATLLGFLHFRNHAVDAAVIEVGIGGRLDATNVIDPILAVITSIGFDHTALLGGTLDKIAREKAGIIKGDTPVVIGPTADLAPIRSRAKEVLLAPPHPSFMEENQAIASLALKRLGYEMKVFPNIPCRFERIGNVIFDVAHNLPALKRVFEQIDHPVDVVVGINEDKDIEECLRFIDSRARRIFFTAADYYRAASVEMLQSLCPRGEVFHWFGEEETLVCGSFYFMGPLRQRLLQQRSDGSPLPTGCQDQSMIAH